MKKTRRNYTREFKIEIVRLLETSGKSGAQLERELGIGDGCVCRWKREFAEEGENAFPGHGCQTPDQERIRQLERENSENRIARLMRLRGLRAKQSKRYKTTTKRNKAH